MYDVIHDHLTSTRNVYDSSKNRLASYDYTPYGEVYASAAFLTANHTYTGHAWDAASGMYFAPFRHYAPGLGRWITPDPLGMVDGTNTRRYAMNNPVCLVDSLGDECWGLPPTANGLMEFGGWMGLTVTAVPINSSTLGYSFAVMPLVDVPGY